MTLLDKNQARISGGRPDPARNLALSGQIAQSLRRLEEYRQASLVFVDPSLLLKQVRINALSDGKRLLMPGPGLKEGFYLLEPYRVPFAKLALAVSGRELPTFGRQLTSCRELSELQVDLSLGESWAVDVRGYGVGEGKGFFDLSLALLGESGALSPDSLIVVAVQARARLLGNLAPESWDVAGNLILTPEAVIPVVPRIPMLPGIVWEALTLDRIRRITPLWKLYVEQGRDCR